CNEQPVRIRELLAREATDRFVVCIGRAYRKACAGTAERASPAKQTCTERLSTLNQLLGERKSSARRRLELAEWTPVRGERPIRRIVVYRGRIRRHLALRQRTERNDVRRNHLVVPAI